MSARQHPIKAGRKQRKEFKPYEMNDIRSALNCFLEKRGKKISYHGKAGDWT